MGRMWPPQSVKTCPNPACFRVRATRCPPVRSAIRDPPLPELFPPDALPVHPLPDQHLPHLLDRRLTAADVDEQAIHAVDEPLHRLMRLAHLPAPACRRLAHRGAVGEGRAAPGQRAETGLVDEPAGNRRPEDDPAGPPVAGLAELAEDGADRPGGELPP